MAKTVVPFAWNPHERFASREVFVRAWLTGSTVWDGSGEGRVHEIRTPATFMDTEGQRLTVDRRDIVAMVVGGDDRYAAIDCPAPVATPTARGTSLTFATPEAAADTLKALGWTVEPPPPVTARWGVSAGGASALMTATAEVGREWPDAHAEPIGEPRFIASYFAIPFVSNPGWWVVDITATPVKIMNGPFSEQHLAQAEADDMNHEDSAR